MDSNIPVRFNEASFRRWESTIDTAVRLFPSRLTLPPRLGYSQETVSCRLRDAIRSLATYRWQPTAVDMLRFDEYYEAITVSREGENVVVSLRRGTAAEPTITPLSATCALCLNKPSDEEVRAIGLLLSNRRLPSVELTGISIETAQPLLAPFDVAVVARDNSLIVI